MRSKISRTLGAAMAVCIACTMTACGASKQALVDFNNDITIQSEFLSKEFEKLAMGNQLLAKGDGDAERTLNEAIKSSKETLKNVRAKLNGLKVPEAPGAKEYLDSVQAAANALETRVKSLEGMLAILKDSTLTDAQREAKLGALENVDLDSIGKKIVETQKAFADKNGFILK